MVYISLQGVSIYRRGCVKKAGRRRLNHGNDQYRVRSLLSWQPPAPPTIYCIRIPPSFLLSSVQPFFLFLLLAALLFAWLLLPPFLCLSLFYTRRYIVYSKATLAVFSYFSRFIYSFSRIRPSGVASSFFSFLATSFHHIISSWAYSTAAACITLDSSRCPSP